MKYKLISFLLGTCIIFPFENKKSFAMDRPEEMDIPVQKDSNSSHSISCSSSQPNNLASFSNHLEADVFYHHQGETEKYRKSVQKLRTELIDLAEKDEALSEIDSKLETHKVRIGEIKKQIKYRKIVLNKYGLDEAASEEKIDAAKEKIRENITNVGKLKDPNTNLGLSVSQLQNLPMNQSLLSALPDHLDEKLKLFQGEMEILNTPLIGLGILLEIEQENLTNLERESNSRNSIKSAFSEKKETLRKLYKSHTEGFLHNAVIFPPDLPQSILKDIGISDHRLDCFDPDNLFKLFARTMELPYPSVKTGEEKEIPYLHLLKAIKQNLVNRLQEDVFGLQLAASMFNSMSPEINLKNYNEKAESYLADGYAMGIEISKDQDLKYLSNILSSYGYQKESSPKMLEYVLSQSSYGLLELCIASLEFSSVTSWSDAGKISIPARLNNMKNGEFSSIVAENIFDTLGRHINKLLLDKIEAKLQAKPYVEGPLRSKKERVY